MSAPWGGPSSFLLLVRVGTSPLPSSGVGVGMPALAHQWKLFKVQQNATMPMANWKGKNSPPHAAPEFFSYLVLQKHIVFILQLEQHVVELAKGMLKMEFLDCKVYNTNMVMYYL